MRFFDTYIEPSKIRYKITVDLIIKDFVINRRKITGPGGPGRLCGLSPCLLPVLSPFCLLQRPLLFLLSRPGRHRTLFILLFKKKTLKGPAAVHAARRQMIIFMM
jgi:hypothetical protein